MSLSGRTQLRSVHSTHRILLLSFFFCRLKTLNHYLIMANLQDLPTEIPALIVSYIQAAKCAITPLAVTSKQCQRHIEILNFRELCIQGSAELSLFSQILKRNRSAALRNLYYEFDDIVPLPLPEDSLRIREERLTASSATFTSAIQDLLVVLKKKSEKLGQHPGVHLNLYASRAPAWPWSYGQMVYLDAQQSYEEQLRRAWLTLREELALPMCPIVTFFCIQNFPPFRLFDMIWPQS